MTSIDDRGPAERPSRLALAALCGLVTIVAFVVARDIVVEPLWLDEAFSLAAARDGFGALLRVWIYHDANPPLHALAGHALLSAWNDDRALRWLSLVCWLGLALFYCRRVWQGRSPWTEAAVVLCSAAVPHYAGEGRAYAPCFAASILAARFLHDGLEAPPTVRSWLSATAFATLAAGLHYFGYLVFGYVCLQLVLRRRWPPVAVAVAVPACGCVLGFWLLFHGSWLATNAGGSSWIVRNSVGDSALFAFVAYGGWPQVLALIGLVAIAFAGRGALPAHVRLGWLILAGFNVLVLALDRATPLVVVRYFLPLLALALVLAADSLAVAGRVRDPRPAGLALALYVAAFGATLVEQHRGRARVLTWEPQVAWVMARNAEALPVVFVLDDPVSFNLTRYQHERMANVFGGRDAGIVAFGSDAASVMDLERFIAGRDRKPFYLVRAAAASGLRRGEIERVWRTLDLGDCAGSESAGAYGIACRVAAK